eukprot:355107-Prymnesium_polylepis.1
MSSAVARHCAASLPTSSLLPQHAWQSAATSVLRTPAAASASCALTALSLIHISEPTRRS